MPVQVSGELKDVRLKAGNPDDEAELRGLVKLFAAVYGESFPSRDVYNIQFWNKHIGTRFSSLLALSRNKVIGHLALQPDRHARTNVQLAFPAIDPGYQPFSGELAGLAWEVIAKQSARQHWRSMYMKTMADRAMYQQIGLEVFGMSEVAIYPSYYRVCQDGALRPQVAIIYQRVFDRSALANGGCDTLYVPRKHLELCRHLYERVGLRRSFKAEPRTRAQYIVPADRRAVERQRLRGAGIAQVFVYPSLLDSFSQVEHVMSCAADDVPPLMIVSTQDPRCPSFCSFLEERGYHFSGVLPLLRNRESIVYHRVNGAAASELVLYSDTARTLAQYIQSNQPPFVSDLIPNMSEARIGYREDIFQ